MDRDTIIRLAQEAGLIATKRYGPIENYERFAVLVAAHEREECAKVADLVAKEIDDTNGTATYIATAIRSRT